MGFADTAALTDSDKAQIRDHTLIRRIENFDPNPCSTVSTEDDGGRRSNLEFVTGKRQLIEYPKTGRLPTLETIRSKWFAMHP